MSLAYLGTWLALVGSLAALHTSPFPLRVCEHCPPLLFPRCIFLTGKFETNESVVLVTQITTSHEIFKWSLLRTFTGSQPFCCLFLHVITQMTEEGPGLGMFSLVRVSLRSTGVDLFVNNLKSRETWRLGDI